MNLNTDGDTDMAEVQGSGDAHEENDGVADDDEAAAQPSSDVHDGEGLMKVLRAFKLLKKEFDEKFKVIWS